jgi:hypothetical protein
MTFVEHLLGNDSFFYAFIWNAFVCSAHGLDSRHEASAAKTISKPRRRSAPNAEYASRSTESKAQTQSSQNIAEKQMTEENPAIRAC